jgi:hypothetical protein
MLLPAFMKPEFREFHLVELFHTVLYPEPAAVPVNRIPVTSNRDTRLNVFNFSSSSI